MQGQGKRQQASRSKVKQSRNNARNKATLKSDLLPVSSFLPATTTKERAKERNERRLLSFNLQIRMILLIGRSVILPAYLAASALLPTHSNKQQSKVGNLSMRRRLSRFNLPRRQGDSAYQKEHGPVSHISFASALLPAKTKESKKATKQKQTNALLVILLGS
jgi:hypothetical protein